MWAWAEAGAGDRILSVSTRRAATAVARREGRTEGEPVTVSSQLLGVRHWERGGGVLENQDRPHHPYTRGYAEVSPAYL